MYDLASLTKVIATTTAVMLLYDRHRIELDAPASRYLPRWRVGAASGVTIRQLLTHRSGLPPGRELWRLARTPAAARRAVLATPLECPPGERYVYSDLGADIRGFVVEAIAQEPLDEYLARHVYRRLGMHNTRFRPTRADDRRVARTEAPLGRVHDRNAATLGGVSGHAGLFSSAGDLAILSRMMLQGGVYRGVRIVSDTTIARFTTRTRGTRALGWDTCAGGASCGQYMDTAAYGHTGYTGTSIWIDPDHDLFVIVLANWASGTFEHPTGPGAILADVRADIADLAEATVAASHADSVARRAALTLRSDGARGW
jgi:CubicO group peptidase (beta-lactamase class C family)